MSMYLLYCSTVRCQYYIQIHISWNISISYTWFQCWPKAPVYNRRLQPRSGTENFNRDTTVAVKAVTGGEGEEGTHAGKKRLSFAAVVYSLLRYSLKRHKVVWWSKVAIYKIFLIRQPCSQKCYHHWFQNQLLSWLLFSEENCSKYYQLKYVSLDSHQLRYTT